MALTIVVVAMLTAVTRADEDGSSSELPEFIRPYPVVGVSTDADDDVKSAASEIASAIRVDLVIEGKTNPVCCVWIEISRWTPNPGTPGYIIVNQPGGSIITASNAEQLRLAVKRFKESIRVNDGEIQVPTGLLTNYSVVEDR
jgi:hypothetical protein